MWQGQYDVLQVAILAGDFLLARASVSLAALRNSDVIQLLSQVIEDLVSGEIMQVTGLCSNLHRQTMQHVACYVRSERAALVI